MAEEIKQVKEKKPRMKKEKVEEKKTNIIEPSDIKQETPQIENKTEEKIEEVKKEEIKTEEKKAPEKKKEEIKKKDFAIVNGFGLQMSMKEAADICDMIRGKTTETAIKMLEEVVAFKRVVKMNKREVPHQKGKGIMAGRYPIKSSKEFLRMVKQLAANGIVNGLEIEKCGIYCKANYASRPFRRGGSRFKRANIFLRLEPRKLNKSKNKK